MAFEIIGDGEHMDVVEFTYDPGRDGPDPHIHRHHSDAFRVLEGELELQLGPDRERVRLPAGGFALAPPGVVHTFRNPGPAEARFLNFHAPSMGFAAYMRGENPGFDQHEPPEDGGRPLGDALMVPPGTGEELALGPNRLRFVAQGSGNLSLSESTFEAGSPGPLPHVHETFTDSFYVLEGELSVRSGDDTLTVRAGDYAYAPPGTVHTFWNGSDAPVRFLNIMAPGGFEQYLKEVAALPGPPDPAAMAAIASRYDFSVVT